jgi:hypothetical protein
LEDFGDFFENYRSCQKFRAIWTRNGSSYNLGDFFTKASGRPVQIKANGARSIALGRRTMRFGGNGICAVRRNWTKSKKKSLTHAAPGLPDFSWSKIPKQGKIYQITTKYT